MFAKIHIAKIYTALLISVFMYLLFFYPLLNSKLSIYSGTDSTEFHYPIRSYFYNSIKEGRFPFWTEKIFSGFPIYASVQSGYLHPLNIIGIVIFGPVNSYKITHFISYLIGSGCFYLLLKRKGINLLGFSAGNLIYFFSFFHLYHQQHFNMILVTYLIPANILVMDLFIEKRERKYIFLNALLLANAFLLGSLQILVLILISIFLYLSIFKVGVKTFLHYGIFLCFYLLIFTAPLLLPATESFLNSSRSTASLFYQGSFLPVIGLNGIYPFVYGHDNNYIGTTLHQEYFVHEIYFYAGITGTLLAICGYLRKKPDQFDKYLQYLHLLFFLLAFVKYIPILNNISLPLVSYFRYWGRASVLFSLVISIYAAYFVSQSEKELVNKKRLLFLISAVFVFFIFQLINFREWPFILFARYLKNEIISGRFFTLEFYIWTLLLLLTAFLILLKNRYVKPYIYYVFFLLVLIDISYFGRIVLNNDYRTVDKLIPNTKYNEEFENKRVLYSNDLYNMNKGFYYNSWGIFGYNEFEPYNYKGTLKKLNNVLENKPDTKLEEDYYESSLKDLGIYSIVEEDKTYIVNKYFPLKEGEYNIISNYVEEGYLNYTFEISRPTVIETFIKSSNYWKLVVNGKSSENLNASDTFLSFPLEKGMYEVELKYVPLLFYYGTAISILLGAFGIFTEIKLRKK